MRELELEVTAELDEDTGQWTAVVEGVESGLCQAVAASRAKAVSRAMADALRAIAVRLQRGQDAELRAILFRVAS